MEKNKPYRITYMLFSRDYSANRHIELYNQITSIKENNDIGIEESINQINSKYDEIYKKNDQNIELHTYIFIGLVKDEHLRNLLSQIEINKEYLEDGSMDELNKNFKYDCRETWGEFDKYTKIKFIYSFIQEDDTIFYIKNSIFSQITGPLPEETIFNVDTMYLTTRLEYPHFIN